MKALLGCTMSFLFGCHHSRLSRVFTIGGSTYRVCYDCGAKFEYSLETMSIRNRFVSHSRALHLVGAMDR